MCGIKKKKDNPHHLHVKKVDGDSPQFVVGVQSLEETASSEDEIEREIREVNSSTASGYSSDQQEGPQHPKQPLHLWTGETDQWQGTVTSQPEAPVLQLHRRTGEQPADGCHRNQLRYHHLQLTVNPSANVILPSQASAKRLKFSLCPLNDRPRRDVTDDSVDWTSRE